MACRSSPSLMQLKMSSGIVMDEFQNFEDIGDL
jgi:hypothetical protein